MEIAYLSRRMTPIVLCIPADRLMHGFAGGGEGGGGVEGVRGVQISPVPFNPGALRSSHESSLLRSRPALQLGRGHNEATASSSHSSSHSSSLLNSQQPPTTTLVTISWGHEIRQRASSFRLGDFYGGSKWRVADKMTPCSFISAYNNNHLTSIYRYF